MTFTLAEAEYETPELTAGTLRRLKRLAGMPVQEMDTTVFCYAVTALAAGVTYGAAADLWREHRIKYGAQDAARRANELGNALKPEIDRRIIWLSQRSPAVRAKWEKALKEER